MIGDDSSLTWADLDGTPLEFVTRARPSPLCLVAHAQRAVLHAEREGWIAKVRTYFIRNLKPVLSSPEKIPLTPLPCQGRGRARGGGRGCRRGMDGGSGGISDKGQGYPLMGGRARRRSIADAALHCYNATTPYIYRPRSCAALGHSATAVYGVVVTFPHLPLHLLAAGHFQDPEFSHAGSSHAHAV